MFPITADVISVKTSNIADIIKPTTPPAVLIKATIACIHGSVVLRKLLIKAIVNKASSCVVKISLTGVLCQNFAIALLIVLINKLLTSFHSKLSLTWSQCISNLT